MAEDARISTALPGHPKARKLERRLGPAGARAAPVEWIAGVVDAISRGVDAAERNLLGAVLLENSAWEQAAGLPSDHFSRDSHRLIHRCMAAIVGRGDPITQLVLEDELQRRNELSAIGGPAYLCFLTDGAVTVPEHLRYCVNRIRSAAGMRRIALVTEVISKRAGEPGANISELRARLTVLDGEAAAYEAACGTRITSLNDIPDLFSLDLEPIRWTACGARREGPTARSFTSPLSWFPRWFPVGPPGTTAQVVPKVVPKVIPTNGNHWEPPRWFRFPPPLEGGNREPLVGIEP